MMSLSMKQQLSQGTQEIHKNIDRDGAIIKHNSSVLLFSIKRETCIPLLPPERISQTGSGRMGFQKSSFRQTLK